MILQIANKPGFYVVPSSDGQRAYEVHGRTYSCTCPDYQWRRAGTIHFCKHGRALKAHLDALSACPQCGGRGSFLMRGGPYASGNESLPCSVCNGTGVRERADPRLVAVAEAYREEQSLRDLFK
jgi:DnaJ-class molecular chaperone